MFRQWLEQRYQTIEELNFRWSTTFWSHTYQNFQQVEAPSPMGETKLHGLNLDWKRFVTHQTKEFAQHEKQALIDGGSDVPVVLNFMGDYDGLNYRKFKDIIDVASWDSYPYWHREAESYTAMETGMQHDFMRSLLKKPFLLMESSPSSTDWQEVSKLRKPGMLELASLQAVAHGSDSVLYFQLRQSRGASEKFHGAVIDHYGGEDSRIYQEVCKVGEVLEGLSEIVGTMPDYVCADMEQDFYTDFISALVDKEQIQRPIKQIPEGVEVTVRKSEKAEYMFVQNFNRTPVEISLPLDSYEVIYGESDGMLGRFATVILRKCFF